MTQYEMAENISEKCNVTMEEARNALEAGDWNMLAAAQQIEVDKVRRMQEVEAVASSCAAEAARMEAGATEAQAQAAAAEAVEGTVETGKVRGGKRSRGKGFRNLLDHVRRLVACGNRNRFTVRKGDETVLELPVTVLAIALLCAFWVCVPLLVIGLFTGCRYGFNGRELGREGINSALGKAADAAERVKRKAAEA